MAHDWGHVLRQGASTFVAGLQQGGGAPLPIMNLATDLSGPAETLQTMTPTGAADCSGYQRCGTPRYLTYDCKDGTFKPRSRRRRRRLLTGRDISDLAALQAIAGKGAALQMAIATAVRR